MLERDDSLAEDFEYVVERKMPGRVCFGSSLPRNTSDSSPFMRRFQNEENERTSACSYHSDYRSSLFDMQTKIRSKKGVGGLASVVPRWSDKIKFRVPSPSRYSFEKIKEPKRSDRAPFLQSQPRMKYRSSSVPGPGTYECDLKRCRRTRFDYNFGKPTMIPATELFCAPALTDVCEICSELCDGDYWHIDYTTYMCHKCREEEKLLLEAYTTEKLKQFKKIRICTFKHRHEGTTATIWLMPKSDIQRKERRENYLSLYMV